MLIAFKILAKLRRIMLANSSKPTSNTRHQALETEASYLQAN